MLKINSHKIKVSLSCYLGITISLLIGSCNKVVITTDSTLSFSNPIKKTASLVSNINTGPMLVMDHNFELIYLGSILNGKDLLEHGSFNPITNYTKLPITISTSINGTEAKTIERPRLSLFRQTVNDILNESPILHKDIFSFYFYSRPFNDYSEISQEFGYKINTKGLFSSSTSSLNSTLSTIKKKNGIIAGFEIINFTADMSSPRSTELISYGDLSHILNDMPVYINSIHYGQKGILAIETNSSIAETRTVFEKITRGLFKKKLETLSSSELNIVNNSTIKVLLIGGAKSGNVSEINGYSNLIQHITSLEDFSANNPGYPIQFTVRKL